jgi:serine/threonine-protein kinase
MSELKLENCRLDDRFDILECLGRGSYAEIFVARVVRTNGDLPPKVVIKALNTHLQGEPDPELERTLIENFRNEAEALDRVRHPNIISRLGHGVALDLEGHLFHYLVLEYLPGGDLAKLCNKRPLQIEDALFYLEQICRGLAHAHSRGVIHRDIKPHNLLLTEDRRTVKIADFGVAKIKLIEMQEGAITKVGTEIYAAPEHNPNGETTLLDALARANRDHLTPAADVYSLAKTTFMLITGRAPREFSRRPITKLPENIADEAWAADVLRVLERATQTDPGERYQSVTEFWQELQAAVRMADENAPTRLLADERTVIAAPALDEGERELKRYAHPSRIVIPVAAQTSSRPQRVQALAGSQVDETDLQPIGRNLRRRVLNWTISLLFSALFVALLFATHNYVSQWRQARLAAGAESRSSIGQELVATTDINLRSGPGASYPRVGLAERGSLVRVLDAKNNWVEVIILQHGRPKEDPTSADRGWVNGNYLQPK